jgi:hypothetical protein
MSSWERFPARANAFQKLFAEESFQDFPKESRPRTYTMGCTPIKELSTSCGSRR